MTNEILKKADGIVSGSRNEDYGKVEDNFAQIATGWSVITGTKITPRQVAKMMIWLKVARDNHKEKEDNIVDIAGYAACIGNLKSK